MSSTTTSGLMMNGSKSLSWLRPMSSGGAALQDKTNGGSYYQNLQHKNSTQNIHSILKIDENTAPNKLSGGVANSHITLS